MAPVDTSYYDLLEVAPDAKPKELSSAYRKKALELHPDKGGNEEQFKKMKAAYDVLKDPQKRQLYDEHGPAIARAMDGEVAAVMEVAKSMMKAFSRMVLCALPFVAMFLFLPAIVLSLKWDERISWNWAVIFIPVWIPQLLVVLIVLKIRSVLVSSDGVPLEADEDEEDAADTEEKKRKMTRCLLAVAGIGILAMIQEAVLAIRLEGVMDVSWFLVFIPYVLIEMFVFYIRSSCILSETADDAPASKCTSLLSSTTAWCVLRFSTVVLLAAKADQLASLSWTLCALPVCVGAGVQLLWSCRKSMAAKTRLEEEEEVSEVNTGFVGTCFAVGGWLTILLLTTRKLDGSQYSAFIVFLPYYLIVALALCCCCCLAWCGPALVAQMIKMEQEEARSQQESHGEAARLNPQANGSPPVVYNSIEQSSQGLSKDISTKVDGNNMA